MTSFKISHDVLIEAPATKIFEAITLPEHINNWWTKKCEGKAIKGSKYRFYFTPEYDWQADVQEVTSNESITYKMTNADEDWNPTSFKFKILQNDKGCTIQFEHLNWQSENHHFRRTSYCWAMLLNGLKIYLEKGIILPFEDRE